MNTYELADEIELLKFNLIKIINTFIIINY